MTLVSVLQTSTHINDKPTSILIQPFADRVLVLVTQLGKVGNLIQASLPSTIPLSPPDDVQSLPPPPPALHLTTLLGSAPSSHMKSLHSLYASQIATLIWLHESSGAVEALRRSIIVGLALHPSTNHDDANINEDERETFYSIMDMLKRLLSSSST
ncbi:hypothetical protein AMATHDRAFT_563 [Amanita thiersii Skay4041]|uniref:Proteasome assembly chaperone 3 n=1 Tax=Amanita thiersii Skay4041 TaxID=703135 RepID=A0A2A9NUS0_9AGAR|nr:hypothetical protein AMATHDRAFT_563 [Amanita thiersii Skay4041]